VRVVLVAFVLQASVAVLDEDGAATLDGKPFDPSVESHRLPEVSKIQDFKTMHKYIRGRMDDVLKQQLARTDGADEEVAIGNTLKNMEAKAAVENELNTEMKADCDVGEWSKWGKCSKLCDGGKMTRSRKAIILPKNGGTPCPPLENSLDCNTLSCASEEHQRNAARRELTHQEHIKERAANNLKMRSIMKHTRDTRTMMKKTRELMRKMVHTEVATIKVPGQEGPRSDASKVRKELKAAMAKNKVDSAMKTFEKATGLKTIKSPRL